MPVEPSPSGEATVTSRNTCCPGRLADEVTHVRTMVLISFDGALDRQTGEAMCASVHRLLDVGIGPIFLDLSGIARVDANGMFQLVEMLNSADARGGGVALLESSVALAAYLGDA
jgi:anti-anti-sigma regulatory factor